MGVVDPLLEDALQGVGEELAALTKSKSFAGVKNAARRSGLGGGFDLGDESEGGGQSGFLGGRSDSEADGLDNHGRKPFLFRRSVESHEGNQVAEIRFTIFLPFDSTKLWRTPDSRPTASPIWSA